MAWAAVPVLSLAGAGAGAGARVVLARLRRGARVAPPWCEIAVAGLWGLVGVWKLRGGDPGWVPVLLALGWLAVALSITDLTHRRLPDALTLPALPVLLLLLAPLGPATLLRAVAGAAVLAAVHAVVHLITPAGMGAGDVKLAAPLGAVLAACSWIALLVAPVLAAIGTAATGVAVRLAGTSHRGDPLPHGVAMLAAGLMLALLAAPQP